MSRAHAEPQSESGGPPREPRSHPGFPSNYSQPSPDHSLYKQLLTLYCSDKLWTWGCSALTAAKMRAGTVRYITSVHVCVRELHPLTLTLVLYAPAKWKSVCDRAVRQAVVCGVDNTSGFKCLGPINTTKGLGRWIQTKGFLSTNFFLFFIPMSAH